MPPKRGLTALESSPSQASTSSVTIEDASSHVSGPSLDNKQSKYTLKRLLWNTISSLSPPKRQKTDSSKQTDGKWLLTGSATSDAVSSASSPSSSTALILKDEVMPLANGFVDLTPTKPGSSSKTTLSPLLASKMLDSQEGAIRDPLARTHHNTSSSTSSAPITDTRSSSEEAAEMQIQHTWPPPSPEPSAEKQDSTDASSLASAAHPVTEAVEKPTEEVAPDQGIPAANPENKHSGVTAVAAAAEADHDDEQEHKPESEQGPQLQQENDQQKGTMVNSVADAAELAAESAKEPEGIAKQAAPQQDDMLISASQTEAAGAAMEDSMVISNSQKQESPAADEISISTSQSQKEDDDDSSSNSAAGPLPTDEDVDHIQMIANAKVGEHVQGLFDWSGSLRTEEPHSSSASSSLAGDDSNTEPIHAASLPSDTAAEVVDLVSDSEDESDSAQDDPDKENDGSLVNATPRLDSDAILPSISSQNATQSSLWGSRPRGSLVGPLALSHKQQHQFSGASQSKSLPRANGLDTGDTSATEQVRAIGRQTRFHQPSRGRNSLPQTSTPHYSQPPPPSQNRSFSFSSDVSIISSTANTSYTRRTSSTHRKRDHIFHSRHVKDVEGYHKHSNRRIIEKAMNRVNIFLKTHRRPPLSREQIIQLTDKAIRLRTLIAADNKKVEPIDEFMAKMVRRLTMQKRDAELGVLPLPKAKLVERERLAREQKAKERRMRGVLGRKELPPRLSEEQERAVDVVIKKPGKIAEIPGAEVNDRDVQKLRPGQWLNDEIINFYGNLILLRANEAEKKRDEAMASAKIATPALPVESAVSKQNGTRKKVSRPYDESLDAFWRIHFFSSFFWANLKQRGFDGVKRWTRRIDIFSKDIILFPINLGNSHWVCGAINMRKHRFEYYDSMGAPNEAAFDLMRAYVTAEALDKKKKNINLRGWRDMFSDESPQQENGFDCGVFAAQTLEQISRRDPHTPIPLEAPVIQWKEESLDEGAGRLKIDGAERGEDEDDELDYEWNFGQENMPYLRRRMAFEIWSKKLLD